MSVAVVVPYRSGCPHRERAWIGIRASYELHHPDWEIVTAAGSDGPFSRTRAIVDAAAQTDADVLVVADADVWCDGGLQEAVDHAAVTGWAIPHLWLHRLAEKSTADVLVYGLAGWRHLPLSTDNRQDSKPYKGHEAGTLLVLTRQAFELAPPDPRFVGWGQEDDAWAAALRLLVGPPWRGGADLVHLWHPAQPRKSRVVGSEAGYQLARRYRRARTPQTMRELIAEAHSAGISGR